MFFLCCCRISVQQRTQDLSRPPWLLECQDRAPVPCAHFSEPSTVLYQYHIIRYYIGWVPNIWHTSRIFLEQLGWVEKCSMAARAFSAWVNRYFWAAESTLKEGFTGEKPTPSTQSTPILDFLGLQPEILHGIHILHELEKVDGTFHAFGDTWQYAAQGLFDGKFLQTILHRHFRYVNVTWNSLSSFKFHKCHWCHTSYIWRFPKMGYP